jgi:hypothetical protein
LASFRKSLLFITYWRGESFGRFYLLELGGELFVLHIKAMSATEQAFLPFLVKKVIHTLDLLGSFAYFM